MKILFYTSTDPGFRDWYNVNLIIKNNPQLVYKFVTVIKKKRKFNRLRNFLSEIKNGKNHFRRDYEYVFNLRKTDITLDYFKKYPKNLVESVNDKMSEKEIISFDPDLIIQCGAGILKENIYNLSKIGTINHHCGVSPEIRGIHSTFWCLLYGINDKIGFTIHFIDENLDTGMILYQYIYDFDSKTNFSSIMDNLIMEGGRAISLIVRNIEKLYIQSNGKLDYIEKPVKSFYFGAGKVKDYNKLKKNNFRRLKDVKNKEFKILSKKTVINKNNLLYSILLILLFN